MDIQRIEGISDRERGVNDLSNDDIAKSGQRYSQAATTAGQERFASDAQPRDRKVAEAPTMGPIEDRVRILFQESCLNQPAKQAEVENLLLAAHGDSRAVNGACCPGLGDAAIYERRYIEIEQARGMCAASATYLRVGKRTNLNARQLLYSQRSVEPE